MSTHAYAKSCTVWTCYQQEKIAEQHDMVMPYSQALHAKWEEPGNEASNDKVL